VNRKGRGRRSQGNRVKASVIELNNKISDQPVENQLQPTKMRESRG